MLSSWLFHVYHKLSPMAQNWKAFLHVTWDVCRFPAAGAVTKNKHCWRHLFQYTNLCLCQNPFSSFFFSDNSLLPKYIFRSTAVMRLRHNNSDGYALSEGRSNFANWHNSHKGNVTKNLPLDADLSDGIGPWGCRNTALFHENVSVTKAAMSNL